MLVSQRAKVRFSIGKYEDEVYFDVLPMDACHLLLERPWQVYRSAQHDGMKNTYNIIRRGNKYVLSALKDAPTNVSSSLQISGCFTRSLNKPMKNGVSCICL